jgi:hypothetical protein
MQPHWILLANHQASSEPPRQKRCRTGAVPQRSETTRNQTMSRAACPATDPIVGSVFSSCVPCASRARRNADPVDLISRREALPSMRTPTVPPSTHEPADRLRCAAAIVPYPLGEVMAMLEGQCAVVRLGLVASRSTTIASAGENPKEIGKMSRSFERARAMLHRRSLRAAHRRRRLRALGLRDNAFEPRDIFQEALAREHEKVITELRVLKVDLEQLLVSDAQHMPVLDA